MIEVFSDGVKERFETRVDAFDSDLVKDAIEAGLDFKVYDPINPTVYRSCDKTKIAFVPISGKEELMFAKRGTTYESLSLYGMLLDFGYDVDVLTTIISDISTDITKASPNDYDLVIAHFGGIVLDNLVPSKQNLNQFEFLSKIPSDKTLVLMMAELKTPFFQLKDVQGVSAEYRDDKYHISCNIQPVVNNTDLSKVSTMFIGRSSRYLPPVRMPLYSNAYFWNLNYNLPPSLSKPYDIAYAGTARWYGDRNKAFKKFFVNKVSNQKLTMLWAGSNEDLVNKYVGEYTDNITFKESTTNIKCSVLDEYAKAYATVIPYEEGLENHLTPRIVETMMSSCVVLIDSSFPYSSEVRRLLGVQESKEREVKSASHLVSKVSRIKADFEYRSKMIEEQKQIVRKFEEDMFDFKDSFHDLVNRVSYARY